MAHAAFEGRERAFRVTTAFWRVIDETAQRHDAVLVDYQQYH